MKPSKKLRHPDGKTYNSLFDNRPYLGDKERKMDTSSLVHDFPAALRAVLDAVFDRQNMIRLDVCGILFTGEQRVL